MKKKRVIIVSVVVILVAIAGIIYVWQGSEMVEVQTHSYLLDKGYTNVDIKTIDVDHSFVNLILSRNEWTSTVVFMDEPNVEYHFTRKKKAIVSAGVSGDSPKKNELK